MAAQEKNMQEIEKAKKLNHVPWGEEYEKMISGMLYVYYAFSLSAKMFIFHEHTHTAHALHFSAPDSYLQHLTKKCLQITILLLSSDQQQQQPTHTTK